MPFKIRLTFQLVFGVQFCMLHLILIFHDHELTEHIEVDCNYVKDNIVD